MFLALRSSCYVSWLTHWLTFISPLLFYHNFVSSIHSLFQPHSFSFEFNTQLPQEVFGLEIVCLGWDYQRNFVLV